MVRALSHVLLSALTLVRRGEYRAQTGIYRMLNFVSVRTIKGSSSARCASEALATDFCAPCVQQGAPPWPLCTTRMRVAYLPRRKIPTHSKVVSEALAHACTQQSAPPRPLCTTRMRIAYRLRCNMPTHFMVHLQYSVLRGPCACLITPRFAS